MNTFFRYGICCALLISIFTSCNNRSQYNLSFESWENNKSPTGWQKVKTNQPASFNFNIDSNNVKSGRYSLLINKFGTPSGFAGCVMKLPAPKNGTKITLTGYLKSNAIIGGYGGLAISAEDDSKKIISYKKSEASDGIIGMTDWKKIAVEITINSPSAHIINISSFLTGKGNLWVDDLKLTVDGRPFTEIESLPLKKAELDTSFQAGSHINEISFDKVRINQLRNLGLIWGFLKYYHPAVIEGKYQWDAELFKLLPKLLSVQGDKAFYNIIETWIDTLEDAHVNHSLSRETGIHYYRKADFSELFDNIAIPTSLRLKLKSIKFNYHSPHEQYYISQSESTKTPTFTHELKYSTTTFPDAGLRLLALYSYWNKVQYFYPYRYLIKDWSGVLTKFIPEFLHASNQNEYHVTCLRLIESIQDSHANIWQDPILDSIKGINLIPIKAQFFGEKLYVIENSIYCSSVHPGDLITQIGGVSVNALLEKYLPLTPASSYEIKLRDLVSRNGFLLRTKNQKITITLQRGKNQLRIEIETIPIKSKTEENNNGGQGCKLLQENIGYVAADKLDFYDYDKIKKDFANTKGIIFDLRAYPSVFMPFSYGSWLKSRSTQFAKFTHISLQEPGSVVWGETISNGGDKTFANLSQFGSYKGVVVILVNANTQSQGEYTAMALRTAKKAIVIGSKTAGADGDIIYFSMPGRITTSFSGSGVYYPDNLQTQRVGIKIDEIFNPTISDVIRDKDPLLKKAIETIKTSKL
jgi:hypothetical protein